MRLGLRALRGFEADLHKLPTRKLQLVVLELLSHIADGHLQGRPLDKRVGIGDLSDCRKVYFDERPDHPRPNYRLVYRLLPTEVDAITVEAVSTGERYSLDAYIRAVNNLERS